VAKVASYRSRRFSAPLRGRVVPPAFGRGTRRGFHQTVLFCDVLARLFRRDRCFVTANPADQALTKGKRGYRTIIRKKVGGYAAGVAAIAS
jgi:hypothetical protein